MSTILLDIVEPAWHCHTMRDDIHKSAPVPPKWRTLMKHCQREADRGEAAQRSAAATMISEARRELAPQFVIELVRVVSSPQGNLFAFADSVGDPVELGGRGTALERRVTEILRRQLMIGQFGKEGVERAIELALEERQESRLLQMEGHWRGNCNVSDATLLSAAVRAAFGKLSMKTLAHHLVEGEELHKLIPKRRTLKVDDDLEVRL